MASLETQKPASLHWERTTDRLSPPDAAKAGPAPAVEGRVLHRRAWVGVHTMQRGIAEEVKERRENKATPSHRPVLPSSLLLTLFSIALRRQRERSGT